MIAPAHKLPVIRQAGLLKLSRSSVYYAPQPTSPADLALMRILDRWHLKYPFAGSRMLRDMLSLAGHSIGRKHVATLMRKMGIEALYRKTNTRLRRPAHRIYPYLLRGLAIEYPNQVWAMVTTYISMRQGFVYVTAVLDWASRWVLAWRVSNSLVADACVEAIEEAIHRYGAPQIMNTDQGSKFTSSAFISILESRGIQISMDGKGCWRDNVFVERLWKSIKYEEGYQHAYDSVTEARAGISRYLGFYNNHRPHHALDGQTPDTLYFNQSPLAAAA